MRLVIILLTLIFLLTQPFRVIPQNSGFEYWIARYNGLGNGDDFGNDIAVDDNGKIYVAGTSAGSGSGNDIVTLKYNSAGVQQ